MPGNAGYTILMFHILKEWHHLRDLSRSHSDRGGAKDLATFSLRFDFSYFHILLGRGKPCPQMLFSQHFFCRPLLHFPCAVPSKIVFASPTAISSECPLCPGFESVQQYWDNQARVYRSADVWSVEVRERCLSFQMVFSLPGAAVVRAILDIGTLIFDDCAQIYLKLLTSSNFSPLILMWKLMPFVLLVISLVFSVLTFMPKASEVLSRRSTGEATSSSFPAINVISKT